MTEILNAVQREYLLIIVIVTNPKCQITQQSRVDNWRPVKGFLHFYSKLKTRTKTTRTRTIRTMAKCFHFRVLLQKKDLNSQNSATIDFTQIIVRIIRFLLTNTFRTVLKLSIIFWVFETSKLQTPLKSIRWVEIKRLNGSCSSQQKTIFSDITTFDIYRCTVLDFFFVCFCNIKRKWNNFAIVLIVFVFIVFVLVLGLVHFTDPQSMDYHKWTTEMDYLNGLPYIKACLFWSMDRYLRHFVCFFYVAGQLFYRRIHSSCVMAIGRYLGRRVKI